MRPDGSVESKNWNEEPLAGVMEHIVQRHHAYCRRCIAAIESLLNENLRQQGEKHPELHRLKSLFGKFSTELLRHLLREEDTLFPYIARLEEAAKRKEAFPRPAYGTIAHPVRIMMIEHEAASEDFKQIRQACHNYECPPDATPNDQALYRALKELEEDLQVHSELEDKVLFPRAMALEAEVTGPPAKK